MLNIITRTRFTNREKDWPHMETVGWDGLPKDKVMANLSYDRALLQMEAEVKGNILPEDIG